MALVKPVHALCICWMLAGAQLLAQSGSIGIANEVNRLPVDSELHPSLPRVSQGTPSGQPRSARLRRRLAKPQVQNGPEQVLYAFLGGNDGGNPTPNGGLIFDSSGDLYGTTLYGGGTACSSQDSTGCGTAFELTPNGSGGWTETLLHSFAGGNDGSVPSSGLIFDQAGNLYGTTQLGGGTGCSGAGCGTAFELSPNGNGGWTETILYRFCSATNCTDGAGPQGLVFDDSGNLYGTTALGGQSTCFEGSQCGTVFELSPNGSGGWTETVLYSFQGDSDGYLPTPGLVFDRSGNLYGTTHYGGAGLCTAPNYTGQGCGTAFELSPNGSGGWAETLIHTFLATGDGTLPAAGPILDQAGNLYGTTQQGGTGDCDTCGTVFELSPGSGDVWAESILYSFQGSFGGGLTDGWDPSSGLIFDKDGNLYGTTYYGGSESGDGPGTVFELSPNGSGGWTETVQYSFQGGGGDSPNAGLILDQDGNLYGTTWAGGEEGCNIGFPDSTCGVAFEVSVRPLGPVVTFSAISLSFGNQTTGTASSTQATNLTNTGVSTLTITSIGITGANSNEFTQTNNCPSSLPTNGSCNISVAFTPNGLGNANASLTVSDNAAGSAQNVPLTGTGVSGISFSPSGVTFPSQYVGTSGLPQAVTLTNTGDAVLAIASVTASPAAFAVLSSCGATIPVGGNCSVGVFFDPSASGIINGTLTVTDSAVGSPQTVPLTGTGRDFSLDLSSSQTATIAPGQAANYTVAVAPAGGFNQTVTLTCSGAPAQSSCAVSPSSVTLNGSSSTSVTVTVTTAGASSGVATASVLWLAFLPGLVLLGRRPGKRHGRRGIALSCALFIVMMWSACGGGGSGGSSGGATPAGTYNLTVVGTFASGTANLVHSAKFTLVVQ